MALILLLLLELPTALDWEITDPSQAAAAVPVVLQVAPTAALVMLLA